MSAVKRHHQVMNQRRGVGKGAQPKIITKDTSSTRLNENRSPLDDASISSGLTQQIQDNSRLSEEQLQSFMSDERDEVSLTPSIHHNVLHNIEANANVNQVQLLNFVRENSSSSQLQEFMGPRPKLARQHASARHIRSSRILSASQSLKQLHQRTDQSRKFIPVKNE